MKINRRALAAAAVAPIVLVLAACSGGNPTDAPTVAQTLQPGQAHAGVDSTGAPAEEATEQPGSLDPAPSASINVLPAEKLHTKVEVAKGLEVQVTDVQRVKIRGGIPGDISGPGIRIDVKITNNTGQSIDLSSFDVTATQGKTPLSPSSDKNNSYPSATLADGESVTGSFGFNVPDSKSFPIHVQVVMGNQQVVARFNGQVS